MSALSSNLKGETKFRKFVKSIPMATGGLALALAALGNLFRGMTVGAGDNLVVLVPPVFGANTDLAHFICGGLSFAVLVIFALKLFLDSAHAKEELKTPVPASVLPTATMAVMLLCTYIRPYIPDVSLAIWYTAVVVHICLMVFFFRRFVASFKLGNVFPSWFIAFVGLVAISVTAPLMAGMPNNLSQAFNPLVAAVNPLFLGQIAFYVGFVFYFVCLVMVVTRMNKVKVFLEPARPTVAIFTAPMALLVVGYFNSFGVMQNAAQFSAQRALENPAYAVMPHMQREFVYFMLAIALVSYIYVLAMLIPILLKKFYTSYTAFTFPLVISAFAFRLGAAFINVFQDEPLKWLTTLTDITMWIAVAEVAFVIFHYIRYFFKWVKY